MIVYWTDNVGDTGYDWTYIGLSTPSCNDGFSLVDSVVKDGMAYYTFEATEEYAYKCTVRFDLQDSNTGEKVEATHRTVSVKIGDCPKEEAESATALKFVALQATILSLMASLY